MAIPEATLVAAAQNAYDDLYTFYNAGTIKAKATAFWQAINGTFLDATPLDRPCGNWVAVIAGYVDGTTFPTKPAGLVEFGQLIKYLYRLLLLCNQMQVNGQITAAQATAVLTAFNTKFV